MENLQSQPNEVFDRCDLNILKKWWLNIDKINFLIVLGLMLFGLMISASSSGAMSKRIGVEKFFFLKKQLIFVGIALFILVVISLLDEEKTKILALIGMAGTIVLLMMVPIFGTETKGAKRWISLAGFTLQPSEFAKTFFVLFNAFLLQKFYEREWFVKYGYSAALYALILLLFIIQPDFGMSITLTALWIAQLFVSGIPLIVFYGLGVVVAIGAASAYLTLPHVEDRINRFLNSGEKNYQAERSLDAFVNGSFFGTGPGNGVVKKFIPDAHTDFVFAIVGEEYGIISCAAFVLLIAYLMTRLTKRTLEEKNLFCYLAMCGLMLEFAMQTVVNVGVSLQLLPTKGMTLPFISYGGSSMMSMAICFGIILALTKKKYHRDVDYGNIKMIL